MQGITIWHNARCSASRRALELIRDAGFEPQIVDYLRDPPDREMLNGVLAAAGLSPRALLRDKEPAYAQLGLDDPAIDDAALVEAMLRNPALINRPVVITERGTLLCRPPERVLEILPV
ncbi:arsenate reductase (glutaredoxin) [Pseudoxanthomonas spadix]|jgi:arsenate reductase|uniref:Arsenate reductase n=1 Tax=Pseudoxanthomonas spadix (strain BD-a59) TaxID=1045855 RepID=G7UN76_PSEUP|nr:arsenate reductase (glutaredoxin) [Pseudoxanthomonas spadix]AER56580.1 arsenate reductase [Pseudoxanthomonas spadix BD-a59]MBP3975090.1 arsenate reductase (glutaredoxin) [Pseudoxanthomonas spadix]RMW98198.1 arsenate reductase (glutaredoxin) [Pseudoxanthomonas spadix]